MNKRIEMDGSSVARLERRREVRRQTILRAAGAELADSGFNRSSLENIAERVHVTKATLYHYFDSKEALYQAWMQAVTAEVQGRLEPIANSGELPADRLRQLIREEVVLLTTDFPEYARLFTRGADWPDSFQDEIRTLRRAHEQLFRDVVADGIESGEFDVTDETVSRYCLQGVLVYLSEWYRLGGRLDPATLAEVVADTAMRLFAPKEVTDAR
jgi:AcrR family transcriptional regulator